MDKLKSGQTAKWTNWKMDESENGQTANGQIKKWTN